jgi:hypothetical protein
MATMAMLVRPHLRALQGAHRAVTVLSMSFQPATTIAASAPFALVSTRSLNLFTRRPSNQEPLPHIATVRPVWPNLPVAKEVMESIPKRTVPDDKLSFEMTWHLDDRKLYCYPHLKMHPADCKVIMRAYVDQLGLEEDELNIFCKLLGTRYDSPQRMLKISANRFPERLENKKFLILQLEQLIEEAKRIVQEYPEEIAQMTYGKRQYERMYPRKKPVLLKDGTPAKLPEGVIVMSETAAPTQGVTVVDATN